MSEIIIASRNRGKISEIESIIGIESLVYQDLESLGFTDEVAETGSSFEENALLKARTVYERYALPVVADDSGLTVDYLHGAPGIFSARFSGPGATDRENNELLLSMLEGLPPGLRAAYFVCCACFFYDKDSYVTTEGRVGGFITYEPEGENGFGYDPLFYLPEYRRTMAQLAEEEKNRISHRAESFRKLKPHIEEYFSNQ